jgi:hypothetical protein
MAQTESSDQSGTIGIQPAEEKAATLQRGFEPGHFGGLLDNAGEDEVLDTSIPIVDDQVAQIQQFEFVIESVALGRWPGASDVVQVNYGMVSPTLSHQDAESGRDSRLAGADRSVEEYGVDHLSMTVT